MSDGNSRSARSSAASFRSSEAARGRDVASPTVPLVEVLPLRVVLVVEIVSFVIEVVVVTVGVVVFVLVDFDFGITFRTGGHTCSWRRSLPPRGWRSHGHTRHPCRLAITFGL